MNQKEDNKTLYEEVITHIDSAWSGLNKSNDYSHGISDESIRDFKDNSQKKLESLKGKLKKKEFKFSPYRANIIPKKKKGEFRPLQIPEVRDRIVLKALATVVEKEFCLTLDFCRDVSFAYQKNLGVKEALYKIREHYKNGYNYVLEADLKNFFGTVDKERLIEEMILPKLKDDTINKLLKEALYPKLEGIEKIDSKHHHLFKDAQNGIPQGNALSPLISNIYLNPFDRELKKSKFKLVRYADDFVVMCKSKEEAIEAYFFCKEILESNLKLFLYDLESEKTRICNIQKDQLTFLSITFDGDKLYPSKKSIAKLLEKVKDICLNNRENKNLFEVLFKLRWSIDGWVSAYYYTFLEKDAEAIDFIINKHIYSSLKNFGWTLKELGKIPLKYRKENASYLCLTNKQREYSGVPYILKLAEKKRKEDDKKKEKISINSTYT